MIEVKNLCKNFGPIRAVQDISFSVKKGDVLAFLGPNGAGKSTTMKVMAGYLKPTSGKVLVEGVELSKDAIRIKSIIGYMPESTPSYKEMTVWEYLYFICEAYKLNDIFDKLEKTIDLTNLKEVQDQLIETLSKGYRSRLCFASAIIHDPSILLLDEPTDGLDPNQKSEIRNLIKKMSKDKAIVISTHILEEINAMCNKVIIISEGKKVLDGTPKDLEKESDSKGQMVVPLDSAFRKLTRTKE